MILILAYWFILFLLFLPAGVLVKKTFKLVTKDISIVLLLGMFFYTVFFTCLAFFLALNYISFIFSVLPALYSGIYFRKTIWEIIIGFSNSFIKTSAYIKTAFFVLVIGALVKSSASPILIDNESYYVQTIKWLNEYGFVKGLGNLHLFLAQTSSWHVLQAGFNFSFITNSINDINGFLYIACTWYYIDKSKDYWAHYNRLHWISLMPYFSFVFFMFIDSPSPDLPLLMVLPVVLHLFTERDKDDENYSLLFLLIVFLCFIKITIAPFAFLMLFGYRFLKVKWKWIVLTGILIAGLWIAKNVILTGYPLYPFTFLFSGFDWTIPEFSILYTHNLSNNSVYGIFSQKPAAERFISWIMIKDIGGWFNKLIIALLLILPFFRKIRFNKNYRIIYFISVIHFIILFYTSPQFRFFLPQIVFFCAFISSELIHSLKHKYTLYKAGIATGCAVAIFVAFINLNSKGFITNDTALAVPAFVLPRHNSSLNTKYEKITAGNLSYNTPTNISFRYATGNGALPCVNIIYIKWMSHHTGHIPQMRGSSLKDGFYSLDVAKQKNSPH